MPLYRRFLDGVPEYLARHYWWAYLWRVGIWFFDHQSVIDAILFGQYERLVQETLARYRPRPDDHVLQLTCVYGRLTPKLLDRTPSGLHIVDVAPPQLKLARSKCTVARYPLWPVLMNAESLAYRDDVFATVIIFFLLHEMPPAARHRTLSEVVRVTEPGGRVLITEYAPLPRRHWLYRLPPSRWLLSRLEPFLPGFWSEDLDAVLAKAASAHGKDIAREPKAASIFSGFYRVVAYRIEAARPSSGH